MRVVSKVALFLVSLSLIQPAFAEDDPKKDAIHARQSQMELQAFSAGPLFAMAKGDMPYDAAMAKRMAENLKLLDEIDIGSAWMKGTSNMEYPDDTRALPKIWAEDSKVRELGKEYGKAVEELVTAAGNGREALSEKVKAVGKACKNCHDDYRKKDE